MKEVDDPRYRIRHHLEANKQSDEASDSLPQYISGLNDQLHYKLQTKESEIQREASLKHSAEGEGLRIGEHYQSENVKPAQSLTRAPESTTLSSATIVPPCIKSEVQYDNGLKMDPLCPPPKMNASGQGYVGSNLKSAIHQVAGISTPASTEMRNLNQPPIYDESTISYAESSSAPPPRQVIKETVFSSEIHSIEYDSSVSNKPLKNVISNDSEDVIKNENVSVIGGLISSDSTNRVNSTYKQSAVDCSMNVETKSENRVKTINQGNLRRNEEMVVFDDIGDINLHYASNKSISNLPPKMDNKPLSLRQDTRNNCDVNVTYVPGKVDTLSGTDVNVTYDLIQGTMPPPSVCGLIVRPSDEYMTTSTDPIQALDMSTIEGSIDNLYLGEEASASVPDKTENMQDFISSPSKDSVLNDSADSTETRNLNQCNKPPSIINGGKKAGGSIVEIAQYEGSPRRYRPRISNELISNASGASSGDDRTPLAVSTNNPQPLIQGDQTNLLLNSPLKEHQVQHLQHKDAAIPCVGQGKVIGNSIVDELLRFDDMDSLPQETIVGLENTLTVQNKSLQMEGIVDQSILSAGYIQSTNKLVPESMPIPLLNQKSDFDFRYEFSETRKVLDEFFNKAENEFPSETSNANSHIIKSNEAELMNLGSDRPNHVISEPYNVNERTPGEFNDLNYTLRRFSPNPLLGSTTVGQRLAGGSQEELMNSSSIINTFPDNNLRGNKPMDSANHMLDGAFDISSQDIARKDDSLVVDIVNNRPMDGLQTQCDNEVVQKINRDSSQNHPSNTYHISEQSKDTRLLPTSAAIQNVDSNITNIVPSSGMELPVPIPDEVSNTSNTAMNVALSRSQTSRSHITRNSATSSDQTMKDTQNPATDDSRGQARSKAKIDPHVILPDIPMNDMSQNMQPQIPVAANIGVVTSNSSQPYQLQQQQLATALVGNMRLNVAPHYVNNALGTLGSINPQQDQVQHNYHEQHLDLDGLAFKDTSRDRMDPSNYLAGSKGNIITEPCQKEGVKSAALPPNQPYFSENKHFLGVIPSPHAQSLAGVGPPIGSGNIDSRNFTLSPETTDCDSADLESEVSINEGSYHSSGPKFHTAMPILEDGLSSGHASDLEDDVIYSR